MTRVIGTLARLFSVLGLGLIGGLHLLWATGSTWPATDERELADAVAGTRRMPPPGACGAVGGLLIGAATIVATPRGGFASIVRFGTASALAARAAAGGEIQRVVNLCLGAFVSTVGLTIPAVLTIGLLTGQVVVLAESPAILVLIVVSLVASVVTFTAPKVTAIHGAVHVALFAVYGGMLLS